MDYTTWLGFVVACLLISISPGAGAIAAMTSGLSHGIRHGYWTTIGMQIGLLLQIWIVAIGLGALLAASETAFTIIKWFGVGYLCYLGIQQWRHAGTLHLKSSTSAGRPRRRTLVWKGFFVNASNPKAIIFMLAVLPQFLNPQKPFLQQYLILSVTMVSVDLCIMGFYTCFAAKVLGLIREQGVMKKLQRTFGTLYIAAATALACFHKAK